MNNVPPDFLKWLMVVLFAAIAAGAGIATIMGIFMRKKRTIEPQPLIVKGITEFFPKQEGEKLRNEILTRLSTQDQQLDSLRQQIHADRESVERGAKARSAALYEKIDEVRKELTARQEAQRSEMGRFFQDAERALGRIEGKLKH